MKDRRIALIRALPVVLAGLLILTGCEDILAEPAAAPTAASPSETPLDPGSLIGGTIDPEGTTWRGTDSGGDLTVLTLAADHSLSVDYGENSYNDPTDTWSVTDGVLTASVYLNAIDGTVNYTAEWNEEEQRLTATAVTSRTGRTLTVILTRD